MEVMLVPGSYQPSLLSFPPGIALAALLVVIAYAASVRGVAELRGWFLVHSIGLVPYALAMGMAPSIVDPDLATLWYRFGAAAVPLAASAGVAFRLALIGLQSKRQRQVGLSIGLAVVAICSMTPWMVEGVKWVAPGVWFITPGPLAPLWLAVTVLLSGSGLWPLARAARAAQGVRRRRQLRRVWIASAITTGGLIDAGLPYGVGWVPMGWLFLGAGSVLTMRALVLEDLLRVRAIDTRAPRLVFHVAGALFIGWAVLELLDGRVPWWGQAVALAGAFGSIWVAVAVAELLVRGARHSQGPHEQLLVNLGQRCRAANSVAALDELAREVAIDAVAIPASILVPSGSDWGWATADGERLADSAAPDPLLVGWLTGRAGLFVDALDPHVPSELQVALARLFAVHHACLIIPLCSRDEMLGLLLMTGPSPLRGDSARRFVRRMAERLAESLAYLRLVGHVQARVELTRDVQLAAEMQATYLPIHARRDLGRVRVAGVWRPATQCGGDFWAVYDAGAGRALVVIGDVTGHGVASAMVTAAVRGACDVAVRTAGDELQLLALLDCLAAAVHRVGAKRLHMSCLVALIDPDAGDVNFVNAGHASPYLARRGVSGEVELEALVARGHPLGAGHTLPSKVNRKSIRSGDLLIWYTDGITDAKNLGSEAFGDRRLQRLLRALVLPCDPDVAIETLLHAVTEHSGGVAFADDVTLVVAQVGEASSHQPATE
jgi:serine phosphatase RsbU (regulator of sigma subunit)